jgi:hypothetical protein
MVCGVQSQMVCRVQQPVKTLTLSRPRLWFDEVLGWEPQIPGAKKQRSTYLVLDVSMDSLQHPLTGILVGQVGVYL